MAHHTRSNPTSNMKQPWHQFGDHLPNASVGDLLDNPNYNYRVVSHPLEGAGGLRAAKKHGLWREDTGELLGIVSPDYEIVQNEVGLRFFEPLVAKGLASIDTLGLFAGGKRFWILARMNLTPVEVLEDDLIEPYLLYTQGHDGHSAIRIQPTSVRVLCSNTISWALQSSETPKFRVSHQRGVSEMIDELRRYYLDSMQLWKCTSDSYSRLVERRNLNVGKYFQQILLSQSLADEHTSLRNKHMKLQLNKLWQAYEREAQWLPEAARGSAYHALQAVTHYTAHLRGRDSKTRLRENWLGESARLRQTAMDFALSAEAA